MEMQLKGGMKFKGSIWAEGHTESLLLSANVGYKCTPLFYSYAWLKQQIKATAASGQEAVSRQAGQHSAQVANPRQRGLR